MSERFRLIVSLMFWWILCGAAQSAPEPLVSCLRGICRPINELVLDALSYLLLKSKTKLVGLFWCWSHQEWANAVCLS